MSKTKSKTTHLMVSLGLVALIVGFACSPEKGDWEAAQGTNDVEAYQGYLEKYPEGQFRQTAEGLIEDLRFADAEEQGTVEAFEAFFALHPEGPAAQTAQERIESLHLAETEATNSIAGYETFLQLYPEGPSADRARALLEEIYPSFSADSVLAIDGMSALVGNGRIVFSSGKDPETLAIRIPSNEVPVVGGRTCLFCARTVEMAPDLKISTTLFKEYDHDSGPYVASSLSVADLSLSGPLKKDQPFYIVSGPEGATLQKEGSGFRLISGQANLLRGKDTG